MLYLSSNDINTDALITFLNTTNLVELDLSNDSIHGGNFIDEIGEQLLNCIASHPTYATIDEKHRETLQLCERVDEKMQTTTEGQILKSNFSISK